MRPKDDPERLSAGPVERLPPPPIRCAGPVIWTFASMQYPPVFVVWRGTGPDRQRTERGRQEGLGRRPFNTIYRLQDLLALTLGEQAYARCASDRSLSPVLCRPAKLSSRPSDKGRKQLLLDFCRPGARAQSSALCIILSGNPIAPHRVVAGKGVERGAATLTTYERAQRSKL
jgi:hypothetical protein